MGNLVAIVGRPNVGKSTLFNRLTKTRKAIVQETSGVTRDRHYGKSEWGGREFSVVDTGGFVKGSDDIFEDEIRKQVLIAIEECNAVLFVVDVETGITDLDEAVADVLRRTKKPVFVVANKVDNGDRENDTFEFYNFGLGEVYSISAMNGAGSGELLDDLVRALPDDANFVYDEELPRIAIVGKPNVGKSSLTNALLGKERNIVTDISGTTRDSIDTRFNAFGFDMMLVDTAGIRKKAKVNEDIEFYSVMRSIRTIESCDVCLFMIDAEEGIQSQDMSIFSVIERNRKGVVILVNKWDKIEDKDGNTMVKYEEAIKEKLAPFTDIPILFVSALTKQRIHKALETAMEVHHNRIHKISTSKLNDIMLPIIENNPPPAYKGKFIKIKFVTQLPNHSPAFAFFCNLPQYIRDPYKRYLENQLRKNFDLSGIPIRLFFRKK
ncbi:MAG: ribosome biogenesis GTPase Der [Flavobacteriales bacterium]|nr:ribosome biogenesis GTPase Der [Flavobacteriales bacterium]